MVQVWREGRQVWEDYRDAQVCITFIIILIIMIFIIVILIIIMIVLMVRMTCETQNDEQTQNDNFQGGRNNCETYFQGGRLLPGNTNTFSPAEIPLTEGPLIGSKIRFHISDLFLYSMITIHPVIGSKTR